MARGRREVPPCCKRYGSPLYCAAWAPVDKIASAAVKEEEGGKVEEKKEGAEGEEGGDGKRSGPVTSEWMVVLGGGGGEGRSGVPNALLLAQFDPVSEALSDQPVYRLGTEGDVPYRMAVHPGGDGVLCSFPKGCRWFEWTFSNSNEDHTLALKPSERLLTQLEDVGLQLALTFNVDGSLLATGGEDGHLRVFKWSSMELIVDKSDAHSSIKDLDFSSDGKFLVSLGSSGPCRVWDTTSWTVVANLPRETGENFGYCRFSFGIDRNQILYITAMQGQQGKIVSWDPLSWTRIQSKQIVRDPISAFNVSSDGKLLSVGTIEGDVVIANSSNMRTLTMVKKAHLGIVTALVFKDSRALVSASFDASARVTLINDKKKNGTGSIWIFLVILLAVLVYYMKLKGAF